MTNEFIKIAKERGYENWVFPYSEKGPDKAMSLMSCLIGTILISTLIFILSFAKKFVKFSPSTNVFELKTIPVFGKLMSSFGLKQIDFDNLKPMIIDLVLNMFYFSAIAYLIYLICKLVYQSITYLIIYVKRNQSYEREVFVNDLNAAFLKKRIQQSMRLSEHRKYVQSKSSSQQEFNHDTMAEHEALLGLEKMQVKINTRGSVDSPNIIKFSQIIIESPFDNDAVAKLMQKIEKLPEAATRLTQGKTKFGQIEVSDDRRFYTTRDSVVVPDKYAITFEEIEEDVSVYETSFPLSLFIDYREMMLKIKDDAQRYANTTAESVTNLLSTQKLQVKRETTIVSSSTVTFKFELSFDSQIPNTQQLDKILDKTYGVEGSITMIKEKYLYVTLPLPKDYHVPMDVPTMYQDAFGGSREIISDEDHKESEGES